jgi:glucose-1-phosphate cytidylyltransferase
MKVVILAGGFGTRLSEETHLRPKPMVEIGGYPILWHLMKIYSFYGLNDFIICAGYKGYVIKEYFANFLLHLSDATFDIEKGGIEYHALQKESWRVTVVDTGQETMTGGRLARISHLLNGETFCMTYGDGLADVNISLLVDFHHRHRKPVTLTAVKPPGRYGALSFSKHEPDMVSRFREKPEGEGSWVNGGFFVLEPEVFDAFEYTDSTIFESGPLESLAAQKNLAAYRHGGFWRPMDTLRDKMELESLWRQSRAPWRLWK